MRILSLRRKPDVRTVSIAAFAVRTCFSALRTERRVAQ